MKEIKKLAGELGRYTMVSGVAFAVDFFLLFSLTEWAKFYYLVSATISFSLGLVIHYCLSIIWVFRHRSFKNTHVEFMVFLLIGLGGLLINDFIMALFTPLLNGNYLVAKIAAVGIVYSWNFSVRKKILFSKQNS